MNEPIWLAHYPPEPKVVGSIHRARQIPPNHSENAHSPFPHFTDRMSRLISQQGQSQLAACDARRFYEEALVDDNGRMVARLNKNWDADVKAFDAVYDHILHMSDALSDGI